MTADSLADLWALIDRHWGFKDLRPLQEQAIRAALDRRDSLVVMPTGGGKSLCYQAPAALRSNETTVVISPLISLMKDQVDSLTGAEVTAVRVDSTLTETQRRETFDALRAGKVRLLFVSPERMVMTQFQGFLRDLGVRTFNIDEAHCISHWGHDFRPEYRQMASLRDAFPDASFHAFTATATEQVREDIVQQLHLRNPAVLVGNFDRPNLIYRVAPRAKPLEQIVEILGRHRDEAGIIYCPSRKQVDEYTAKLRDLGYNALKYRAANPDESSDFNNRERKATHDAFRAGTCDLVVATVAFGMGIDRSDIRFVIHAGMPKSIEHYQQEAGRAGRDGLEAECIMLHSGSDVVMWKRMAQESADEGKISRDLANHAAKQAEEVNGYAKGGICRHKVLVEHFGQRFEAENCGACDICLGEVDFEPDSTIIAKKVLSCVARVQERYGMGHVADVLRGYENARIQSLGHNKLTTFGLLADRTDRQIKDWIVQLVQHGVLEQTTDEYPILKLNDESWAVMRGQRDVRLTIYRRRAGRTRVEEVSWEGVNTHIFEALRTWRRAVAAERGVPPYTIFHDGTLRDISRTRPSTIDRLHGISGVGEARLREFGDTILKLVADLSAQHGLDRDVAPEPAKPVLPSHYPATAEEAFPHFRAGKSVAEVARLMDRAESTVRQYLAAFIEVARPKSIATWVDAATQARVTEAAHVHGTTKLKPIFLALNQEVGYDAIHITLAYLNSQRSDTT